MSIIGEVLVHYRRHGALYSLIPAHSGRNIRRHKSNNSPRSSSLKAALPKCYHQVSSKPGASRLPGHGITITKIFYFKSISCCDQTDPAIAHFIKLWLGFRSLGFREPFTIYSLPLLTLPLSGVSTGVHWPVIVCCLDIYEDKKPLDAVVRAPRRHQSGAFCAMDS